MKQSLIQWTGVSALAMASIWSGTTLAQDPFVPNVVRPQTDFEGVALARRDRQYTAGGPSIPVYDAKIPASVTLGGSDAGTYLFENQVQGPNNDGVFPRMSLTPGLTAQSLGFYSPSTDGKKLRSELWWEGSSHASAAGLSHGWSNATASSRIPWGEGRWTAFRFLVRHAESIDDVGPAFISQWWQFTPASPPMALLFTKKTRKVGNEYHKEAGIQLVVNRSTEGWTSSPSVDVFYPIPIEEFGRWFDIALYHEFDPSGDGAVKMYLRRRGEDQWRPAYTGQNYRDQVPGWDVSYQNVKIGFSLAEKRDSIGNNAIPSNDAGLRHKFGLYRPFSVDAPPISIRIDNMRNGTNFGGGVSRAFDD